MTPDAAVMKTESPVVDACQSERGRDERRRRFAVRPEDLRIHEELGVEHAGSPAIEDGPHGRLVCAEERGDSAQIRSECDDGADVRREDAEGPVS